MQKNGIFADTGTNLCMSLIAQQFKISLMINDITQINNKNSPCFMKVGKLEKKKFTRTKIWKCMDL